MSNVIGLVGCVSGLIASFLNVNSGNWWAAFWAFMSAVWCMAWWRNN